MGMGPSLQIGATTCCNMSLKARRASSQTVTPATDQAPASVDAIFQHLFQSLSQKLARIRLPQQIAADQPIVLLAGQCLGLLPVFGV